MSFRRIAMRATLVLLICFPLVLTAQKTVQDSLRQLIAHAADLPAKTQLQYELGKSFHFADSIEQYGTRVLKESAAAHYMQGMAYGERLLGDACFYRLQYEDAVRHYARCDSAFQASGEKYERIICLGNAGYALVLLGRYGDAVQRSSVALELAEQIGNRDEIGQASRNIGECLVKQQKYRESLPYFRKSLQWETTNNPADIAYLQMGKAYDGLGIPDSALVCYQKSLESAEKTKIPFRISTCQQALGTHYLQMGDFANADRHLKSALDYFQVKQDKFSAPGLFRALSDLELKKGNYSGAIDWGEKALVAMQENRQDVFLGPVHASLYQAYQAMGQYEKALEHAIAWKTASDSLAAKDNARKIAEVEARHRSREQESLIARQQFEIGRQRALLLIGLLALLRVPCCSSVCSPCCWSAALLMSLISARAAKNARPTMPAPCTKSKPAACANSTASNRPFLPISATNSARRSPCLSVRCRKWKTALSAAIPKNISPSCGATPKGCSSW